MRIKRIGDAAPYSAPNHHDVGSLRLQGFEEGGPQKFWVGLSHYLPGGGAGPDSSPLEKVYVVLSGEIALHCKGETAVLGPMDSCCIGPGEIREVKNISNAVASILVVMPYPENAA